MPNVMARLHIRTSTEGGIQKHLCLTAFVSDNDSYLLQENAHYQLLIEKPKEQMRSHSVVISILGSLEFSYCTIFCLAPKVLST